MFAARLAAAHEAGKVVLLDVVDDEGTAAAEEVILATEPDVTLATDHDPPGDTPAGADVAGPAREAADRLEAQAAAVRARVDVPCEVVVASGDPVDTALATADETGCDLIVTPFERDADGSLAPFPTAMLDGPIDAVVFRSWSGVERWKRIMVPVARPGDSAHAMIDFAERLAGDRGHVSVCTCIDSEVDRRPAENRLANLVETTRGEVETRV
jgi:hypothetical protein